MGRCYKAHETKSFHLVKLLMTQIFSFCSVPCLPYNCTQCCSRTRQLQSSWKGAALAQTGLVQMPRQDSLGGHLASCSVENVMGILSFGDQILMFQHWTSSPVPYQLVRSIREDTYVLVVGVYTSKVMILISQSVNKDTHIKSIQDNRLQGQFLSFLSGSLSAGFEQHSAIKNQGIQRITHHLNFSLLFYFMEPRAQCFSFVGFRSQGSNFCGH